MPDPSKMRELYDAPGLSEETAAEDPFEQFRRWFEEAAGAGFPEPNAMALATASAEGRPSVRMMLLKGVDERGFTFFTNYESRKGRELAENPRAALLFFWDRLHRQLRVEGTVERVSGAEADAYFASRPYGHRIGAWASRQGREIASREELEARFRAIAARYPGEVPRPPYWGGFRLLPEVFEFWQGREDRMHDRLAYFRENGGWRRVRLQP